MSFFAFASKNRLYIALLTVIFLLLLSLQFYVATWLPMQDKVKKLGIEISELSIDRRYFEYLNQIKAKSKPPFINLQNLREPDFESESDAKSDFYSRENQIAQEAIAKSSIQILTITFWQLGFFIFSTLGSFIAIYLVYKTYKGNILQLEEAKKVNALQLQPWIEIAPVTMSFKHYLFDRNDSIAKISHNYRPDKSVKECGFEFKINITNQGRTPIRQMLIELLEIGVEYKTLEGSKIIFKKENQSPASVHYQPINPEQAKCIKLYVKLDTEPFRCDLQKEGEPTFHMAFIIKIKDNFTPVNSHRYFRVRTGRVEKRGQLDDAGTTMDSVISVGNELIKLDNGEFRKMIIG